MYTNQTICHISIDSIYSRRTVSYITYISTLCNLLIYVPVWSWIFLHLNLRTMAAAAPTRRTGNTIHHSLLSEGKIGGDTDINVAWLVSERLVSDQMAGQWCRHLSLKDKMSNKIYIAVTFLLYASFSHHWSVPRHLESKVIRSCSKENEWRTLRHAAFSGSAMLNYATAHHWSDFDEITNECSWHGLPGMTSSAEYSLVQFRTLPDLGGTFSSLPVWEPLKTTVLID